MTDIHEDDIRVEKEFDEYGVEETDEGLVILKVDSDRNLFDHSIRVRPRKYGILLELVDGDEFEPIDFINASTEPFELSLHEAIVELIQDENIPDQKAIELADDIASSFSDMYE